MAVDSKNKDATIAADEPAYESVGNEISAVSAVVSDTRSSRARRWSRIDSITVKNFKAISNAVVHIGSVTILVGPNGSGKSSLLQAIHWAARAASYITPKSSKETMSFDRMDYLPSSEPLKMAHKGELKSETRTAPTTVMFKHQPSVDDAASTATIKIFAARNKGGVSAHIEGGPAVTPYKQRASFITAYIPGLAGLSERETVLAQPQLRRQAASGDAGSVLRNVLLNLATRNVGEDSDEHAERRLKRLNEIVSTVHPGLTVRVSFNEREDYNISANYLISGTLWELRPLETAATGILQVVQIFAYLILFRPRLLLIDEPDAHLHPDKQERLIETLELAAAEFDTQIMLTTHSPHIVRAASPAAKLVWMEAGNVKTDDDSAIRRLLGWGGLDKSALLFVEDEDDVAVRAIVRQWPELARSISICRCFGIDNLPKDKFLQGLLVDGNLNINAVVHRDGDFMNENEINKWKMKYKTDGVLTWVTQGVDVESYFCEPSYLSVVFEVSIEQANAWRVKAASRVTKARETFLEKRKRIVYALYEHGGSPDAEEMWDKAGGQSPETVLGKKLLAQLKQCVKEDGFDSKILDNFSIPEGYIVAPDLRQILVIAVTSE